MAWINLGSHFDQEDVCANLSHLNQDSIHNHALSNKKSVSFEYGLNTPGQRRSISNSIFVGNPSFHPKPKTMHKQPDFRGFKEETSRWFLWFSAYSYRHSCFNNTAESESVICSRSENKGNSQWIDPGRMFLKRLAVRQGSPPTMPTFCSSQHESNNSKPCPNLGFMKILCPTSTSESLPGHPFFQSVPFPEQKLPTVNCTTDWGTTIFWHDYWLLTVSDANLGLVCFARSISSISWISFKAPPSRTTGHPFLSQDDSFPWAGWKIAQPLELHLTSLYSKPMPLRGTTILAEKGTCYRILKQFVPFKAASISINEP